MIGCFCLVVVAELYIYHILKESKEFPSASAAA
ncbi:MAG: hypothetical protein ACI808_002914, partial [Paraglaciecola sp.]